MKLKTLILEMTKESLAVEFLKDLVQGTEFENKVFIAGGAVRDELMGKPIKDIDLVVDMPNGGIKFAEWATKKMNNFKEESNPVIFPNYGTAKFNLRGVKYKGQNLSEIDIETVMPRSEEYKAGDRKPSVKGASLKADAERRDLTANSLFKNISTGEIIDLTGKGREDLEKGIARTPLDPDQTFSDDPLRMMRLVRFYVKYNWKIPLNIVKSLKRNADQIVNISGERVQDELNKILKTDNAGKAFKLLRQSGLAKYIFPDLNITDEKLKMIQSARSPIVKLSLLFNDVYKEDIERSLKKLKYPNEIVSAVSNTVNLKNFFDESVSPQKIREFRRVAGKNAKTVLGLIDALNKPIDVNKIAEFLADIKDEPIKPPISGYDLIALGVKPGPKFKEILDQIQDKFEEDPSSTKEDYISIIKRNIG